MVSILKSLPPLSPPSSSLWPLPACSSENHTQSGRQEAGVGSCSLLQGIFPTQGLNPSLLHSRQSHQGSPRIPEWVAYPFSSASSRPGIEPGFLALQVDSLLTELSGRPYRRLSSPAFGEFNVSISLHSRLSVLTSRNKPDCLS